MTHPEDTIMALGKLLKAAGYKPTDSDIDAMSKFGQRMDLGVIKMEYGAGTLSNLHLGPGVICDATYWYLVALVQRKES